MIVSNVKRIEVGQVARVVILLLAVMVLVLSVRGLGLAVGLALETGTARPLLRAGFDVGALFSAAVGAWIVLRTQRMTAVVWSLLAYLLGVSGAVVLLLYPSEARSDFLQWSRWFLVGAAAFVGSAGLARFSTLFPRPLTLEDLRSGSKLKEHTMFAFRGVVVFLQSSRLPVAVAVVLTVAAGGSLLAIPLGRGLGGAVEIVTLIAFGAIGVAAMTGVFAASLVEVSYATGDEEGRRKLLWIRWGFYGAIFSLLVALAAMGLGASLLVSGGLSSLPLLLFSLSLSVAVFYDGVIDPRHVIRRTSLYGSLGVALVFLFAGIEDVLANYVLDLVGVPTSTSSLIAAGTIAVAFGPLRSTFRSRIDYWLDEKMMPTALAEAPRHESVIVFSDIVGYTALTWESEDDALTTMSVFHQAARNAAEQAKGRLVKTMGDGVLMEFKDSTSAISAAQALASSFQAACEPLGLPQGQLRTGIHFGEVAKRRDGDLFGDAVNIASRLEGEAEPGQIVVSQVVADQLEGVELEDLGERSLKNVPEPVRCWAIRD